MRAVVDGVPQAATKCKLPCEVASAQLLAALRRCHDGLASTGEPDLTAALEAASCAVQDDWTRMTYRGL